MLFPTTLALENGLCLCLGCMDTNGWALRQTLGVAVIAIACLTATPSHLQLQLAKACTRVDKTLWT